PASTSQSPARTAGEYGPATGGAFGVGTGLAGMAECLVDLARPVPPPDHARLALVPEDAQRRRAERQQPPALGRRAKPGRAEEAEEVAVRDPARVPARRRGAFDHAPGASGRVLERLAAGRSRPHRPSRPLVPDVRRGASLVVAVVPLREIVVDLGAVAVPGQPARVDGARH